MNSPHFFPGFPLGSIQDLQTGEHWSADRLRNEIDARVTRLRACGVQIGHRILVEHAQRPGFFADLLALFEIGAMAAILDANATESERQNIFEFLRPDCVLQFETQDLEELAAPSHEVETGASLILFTSGSTGSPKGVVLELPALLERVRLNREVIGDSVLARTLCMLPTHFGHGLIGNSLTPLLSGHKLHLTRFTGETARDFPTLVSENSISFVSSVPAMWRRILDEVPSPPRKKVQALQRVQIGSAPLSSELWSDVSAWTGIPDVVNTYGITEASNWIAGASARDVVPMDGSIGTPWGGELLVRQTDGTLASEGQGELVVRSKTLMRGYLDRPDLTSEALENGWFRTGDLGRIDSNGCATLIGRIKNEINRGGSKVQPEDVDLVLERHPSVLESCAFGVPDDRLGERVGVALTLSSSAPTTRAELAAWCTLHLRRHAVPERWFFVPSVPKTDRGKVLRRRVRAHCLEAPELEVHE